MHSACARGDTVLGSHVAGGSIQQHYLASYQQALLAVCLAQFSAKRYQEGMQGVLALSLAARPLAVLFQQELGLSSTRHG